MKITIVDAPIECDTTAFTRLSPEEQADFVRRCNADPAFAELEEESNRRWNRSDWRTFFALLLGGIVLSLLFLSHPYWLFFISLLGWLAAWYAAEWWLWLRWYKPRLSEVSSKVVRRELERLPPVAETTSKPTE